MSEPTPPPEKKGSVLPYLVGFVVLALSAIVVYGGFYKRANSKTVVEIYQERKQRLDLSFVKFAFMNAFNQGEKKENGLN